MRNCNTSVTSEWLSVESIWYVASCLEACEDADMLADLQTKTRADKYLLNSSALVFTWV